MVSPRRLLDLRSRHREAQDRQRSADGCGRHAGKISQSIGWGRYRLDVASNDASGPASSVIFSAGWYTTGENVDSPEQLDVALDKESYKSGETAKLRIASKLGGKALITVLGTGLDLMKEVEIAKGGGEVDIPVSDDLGPGRLRHGASLPAVG